MQTDRRSFLRLFGGGLVATATMAEAGMLSEFFSWLQRKPVWSIPSYPVIGVGLTYADIGSKTFIDEYYKISPVFMHVFQSSQDVKFEGGRRLSLPLA